MFSSGDGRGNSVMQFVGSLDDVNIALSHIKYTGFLNWNGIDELEVHVSDQATAGVGRALTDTKVIYVNVKGVSDPPYIAAPGVQSLKEDGELEVPGLSIFDADGDDIQLQVSLSVVGGDLSIGPAASKNIFFLTGDGVRDPAVIFEGSPAAVNDALGSITYKPSKDSNRDQFQDFLTIFVRDQVEDDSDGPTALTHTVVVPLDVMPINDAPSIMRPSLQSISLAGFDIESIESGNNQNLEVTLMVGNVLSTISLSSDNDVTVLTSLDDPTALTFTGDLDQIKGALNGLDYVRNFHFNGGDTIFIRIASAEGGGGELETFYVDLSLDVSNSPGLLPTIHEVVPRNAIVPSGLLDISVEGTGFDGGDLPLWCHFTDYTGAIEMRAVTVLSESRLSCQTPSEAFRSSGSLPPSQNSVVPHPILLRITDQSNVWSNAKEMFMVEAPLLVALSVAIGPQFGGTVLVVQGSFFPSIDSLVCLFSGTVQKKATWLSSESVSCVTPPASEAGGVTVQIGSSAFGFTVDALEFVYLGAMNIAGLVPAVGSIAGGTIVLISGGNFVESAFLFCQFGDGVAFRTPATFISSTQVSCTTPHQGFPEHMMGEEVGVAVSLSDPAVVSNVVPFRLMPKIRVTAVEPNIGFVTGGGEVAIFGSGFHTSEQLSCRFGLAYGAIVMARYESDTKIICTVPPALPAFQLQDTDVSGATEIEVSVNGQDFTKDGIFFYYHEVPSLIAVQPEFGSVGGGTPLHLFGSNFATSEYLVCRFVGRTSGEVHEVSLQWGSEKDVYCVSPSMSITQEARLSLSIRTGTVGAASQVEQLSLSSVSLVYEFVADSRVFSLVPSSGTIAGGTSVKVHGENFRFSEHIACRFDDTEVSTATFISSTAVWCRVPRASSNDASITLSISNNGIEFSNDEIYFQYSNVNLGVTRVSLVKNAHKFSDSIRIFGHGFENVTSLGCPFSMQSSKYQEHLPSTMTTFVSSMEIVCTLPRSSIEASGEWRNIHVHATNNGVDLSDTYGIFSFRDAEFSLISMAPFAGGIAVDTVVSVYGANFYDTEDMRCIFTTLSSGDVDAVVVDTSDATFVSWGEIKCRVPRVDVESEVGVQVSMDGILSASHLIFQYRGLPIVTSIFPEGSSMGGVEISVKGSGFWYSNTMSCKFGDRVVPATFVSSDLLKCLIPQASEFEFIRQSDGSSGGNGSNETRVEVSVTVNGFDYSVAVSDGAEFAFRAQPSVMEASPLHGSVHGGTTVTVRGHGFVNPLKSSLLGCRFGDKMVSTGVFLDSETLQCVSPQRVSCLESSFELTITFDGGVTVLDTNLMFYYTNTPLVSSFSPHSGLVSGNTRVIVHGHHFKSTAVLECSFGRADSTYFDADSHTVARWIDDSTVECFAPPKNSTGLYALELTQNRQEYSASGTAFTYTSVFRVFSMSPTSGSKMGGTDIVVIGEEFDHGMDIACQFGVEAATQASVLNDQSILCKSPLAHGVVGEAVKSVEVVIVHHGGGSVIVGTYEYLPLVVVHSIMVISSPSGEGDGDSKGYSDTVVAIFGTGFVDRPSLQCRLRGMPAALVLFVSAELIHCEFPSDAFVNHLDFDDDVLVEVSTNGIDFEGKSYHSLHSLPVVTSIAPHQGPASGGTQIKVAVERPLSQSAGFLCKFSKTNTEFEVVILATWKNSLLLICTAPMFPLDVFVGGGDGTVFLEVLSPVGDSTSSSQRTIYTYEKTVSVLSVSPNFGLASGGTSVAVAGSSFRFSQNLVCRFGSKFVEATFVSSTMVTCTSPPSTSMDDGIVEIEVCYSRGGCQSANDAASNNELQQTAAVDAVIFEYFARPVLHSVEPSHGSFEGGYDVIIRGSGFFNAGAMSCKFEDSATWAPVTFISEDEIVCTVPPSDQRQSLLQELQASRLTVAMNGLDLCEESLSFAYTFQPQQGRGIVIVPNSGPISGGTKVVVHSLGLSRHSSHCLFSHVLTGASMSVTASRVSKTAIECQTPSVASSGVYTISVEGLEAVDGTTNLFYFVEQAHLDSISPQWGGINGGVAHVYGQNFVYSSNLRCMFGSVVTLASFIDSGEIACPFPPMVSGSVDVAVSNNGFDFEGDIGGEGGIIFQYIDELPIQLVSASSIVFSGDVVNIWVGNCDTESLSCVFGDLLHTSVVGTCQAGGAVLGCVVPDFPSSMLSHSTGSTNVLVSIRSSANNLTTNSLSLQVRKPVILHYCVPSTVVGGDHIQIFGVNFVEDLECVFLGTDNSVTHSVAALQLRAGVLECATLAPASAGMYKLSVRYPGLSHISNEIELVYLTDISVGIFSPDQGSKFGGTLVTVVGEGFLLTQDLQCKFGTRIVPATWVGDNAVQCISPPAPMGDASAHVAIAVSLNGVGFVEAQGMYKFVEVPHVAAVHLVGGDSQGVTRIILVEGEGFENTTTLRCRVGTTFGLPAIYISPFQLSCEASAEMLVISSNHRDEKASSHLNVEVTTNGVDYTVDRKQLRFLDVCQLGSVVPNAAAVNGGTSIVIQGADFIDSSHLACRFEVQQKKYDVEAFWISAFEVVCVSPHITHKIGSDLNGTVSVTNNGVVFSSEVLGFLFELEETITSVSPSIGSSAGGTKVQIHGFSIDAPPLSTNSLCRFGTVLVPAVVFGGIVECVSPLASIGTVDLSFSFDGTNFVSTEIPFEYVDIPIIFSYSPSNGPLTGNTLVVVNGENFREDNVLCRFGDGDGNTTFVSSTELRCITPSALTVGAVQFGVHKETNTAARAPPVWHFVFSHLPEVLAVRPEIVSEKAGGLLNIFGDHYFNSPGLVCCFEDALGREFVVPAVWISDMQVNCGLSPLFFKPGEVRVRLSNNGGEATSSSSHIISVLPTSMVHYTTPQAGPTSGGTLVNVYGTNFIDVPDLRCTFNGRLVKAQFVSTSQITCRTPPLLNGDITSFVQGEGLVVGIGVVMSSPGIVQSESNTTFEFVPPTVLLTTGVVHGSTGSQLVLEGWNMENKDLHCVFNDTRVRADHLNSTEGGGTMDKIGCTVPDGEGSVSIQLFLEDSDNDISGGLHFTYMQAAHISHISPTVLEEKSVVGITIQGTGFIQSRQTLCIFDLAKRPISASSIKSKVPQKVVTEVEWVSEEEVQCKPPANAVGTWVLSIQFAGTSDVAIADENIHIVPIAVLSELEPLVGFVDGGTVMNLYGSNFINSANTACDVEGKRIPAQFVSTQHVRCLAPAFNDLHHNGSAVEADGSVLVRATFNNFDFTNSVPFQYVSTPRLHSIERVPFDSGSNNSFKVMFRPTDESAFPLLPKEISDILPYTSIGCRFRQQNKQSVVIEIPGELIDSSTVVCTDHTPYSVIDQLDLVLSNVLVFKSEEFSISWGTAPSTVHLISPRGGPAVGGMEVKLHGSGFQSSAIQCIFGEHRALETFVYSDKLAMCISPPLTPGVHRLRLSSNNESFDNVALQYESWKTLVVTTLGPPFGHQMGGNIIHILGTGFVKDAVTKCIFGSAAVLANFRSEKEMECISPPSVVGAGSVLLQIIVDGRHVLMSNGINNTFSYIDNINVKSLQPANGWVTGGTAVAVRLATSVTGFVSAVGVESKLTCLFGTQVAQFVRMISEYELECLSPPSSVNGEVSFSVVVREESAVAGYVPLDRLVRPEIFFTYQSVQDVVSIDPARGPTAGGTLVNVHGLHLTESSLLFCKFGEMRVPGRYVGMNEMVCETPVYKFEGPAEMQVSKNGLDFSTVVAPFYFYGLPEVQDLEPSRGPLSGGTYVRVQGGGFGMQETTQFCSFGGKVVPASYVSEYEIVCKSPRMNHAGYARVEISQDGKTFRSNSTSDSGGAVVQFQYTVDPMVYTVTPSASVSHTSTQVVVEGENFESTMRMSCKFGDIIMPASFTSSTRVICESPVIDAFAQLPVLVPFDFLVDSIVLLETGLDFQYNDVAIVLLLEPNFSTEVGNSLVTVHGGNFVNSVGLKCRFGYIEVQASFVSSELLTCLVPPHPPAAVQFGVTFNGLDYVHTYANALSDGSQLIEVPNSHVTFTYTPMVTMIGIVPNSGYSMGGTSVTVHGTGFLHASGVPACKFGGQHRVLASIINATALRCSSPAWNDDVPAVVGLEISMDGQNFHRLVSGDLAQFEFVKAPSVGAVGPDRGPFSGGTVVEVTGANFIGDSIFCKFGERLSPHAATVVSQARVLCVTPPASTAVTVDDEARFVSIGVSLNGLDFSLAPAVQFEYEKRPSVFNVHPQGGPERGGTTVVVEGMDFVESVDLRCLFEKESVRAKFISLMQIECVSPKHFPGATTLRVSNNGHDYSSEATVHFAYHAELVVSGLWPFEGSHTGGTDVLIRGTNYDFFPNLFCKFGEEVVRATFVSAVELKCTSPRHKMGEVAVRISANGVDFGDDRSTAFFRFVPPPTLLTIHPNRGVFSGGTVLTIEGRNFGGSTVVCRFGSSGAHKKYTVKATVQSPDILQCITPAHPAGASILEVSNNGIDFTTSGNVFHFESALSVSAIFPQAGPEDGATMVSVHGTNFKNTNHLSCMFGEVATKATWISSSHIECIAPPANTPGNVHLEVSNNAGEYSFNGVSFYYFGRGVIQSIHPMFGSPSGNTAITINGQNFFFTADLECVFGEIPTQATFVNANTLVCNTPPHPQGGVVSVRISVKADALSANTAAYTYVDDPKIVALHPSAGPVYGSNFIDGGFKIMMEVEMAHHNHRNSSKEDVKCLFGDRSLASASRVNETHFECELPPGQPGMTSFEMTFNGQDFTKSGTYFTYQLPPQLTSVYPSHGSEKGQTKLRVFATDITPTNKLKCRFARVSALLEQQNHRRVFARQQTIAEDNSNDVHIVQAVPASRTEAWCNTPVLQPGTYVVDLTINDLSFTANHMRYVSNPEIAVSSISPSAGPSEGGTVVVVLGSNFLDSGSIVCMFGGDVTPAVYISRSEVRCTTPMLDVGPANVSLSMNGEDFKSAGLVFFSAEMITLQDISPSSGGFLGGTLVTITGSGFGTTASPIQCQFGNTKSGFAEVLSDTVARCQVPPFERFALTGHDTGDILIVSVVFG
jgi:hypothetical protein